MIFLIASVFFISFLSLCIQGWMVMTERFGYYKSSDIPPSNGHPEMADYTPGQRLLVATFEDYNFQKLQNLAFREKMSQLFEEPSSFEDDDDDDSSSLSFSRK